MLMKFFLMKIKEHHMISMELVEVDEVQVARMISMSFSGAVTGIVELLVMYSTNSSKTQELKTHLRT